MVSNKTVSVGMFMAAIICAILGVQAPVIGFLVGSSYVLMWTVVNGLERNQEEGRVQIRFDEVWTEFQNRSSMSK